MEKGGKGWDGREYICQLRLDRLYFRESVIEWTNPLLLLMISN